MMYLVRMPCWVAAWGLLLGFVSLCCAAGAPWEPTGKETPASMKARTSAINRPKVVGTYYEANVPGTLDLAERARLGINHLTSIISEKDDYEMCWRAGPAPRVAYGLGQATGYCPGQRARSSKPSSPISSRAGALFSTSTSTARRSHIFGAARRKCAGQSKFAQANACSAIRLSIS